VFELYPIADSANVEARRAALGIMPLSAYAAFVKKMYAPGGR
jgi:hypothetical protein